MAKRRKKTPSIEVGPYITEAVERYLNKTITQIREGKFGEVKDFDYSGERKRVASTPPSTQGGRAYREYEAEGIAGYEINAAIDPEGIFTIDKLGSTKQLLFVPYRYSEKTRKFKTDIGTSLQNDLVRVNSKELQAIKGFLAKSTDVRLKEMSDNLRVNIKDRGSKKGAQIVFVPYRDPEQFSLIIAKINAMVKRYKRFKKYKDFYLLDQGAIELIDLYNNSLSADVSVVSLPITEDPKDQAEREKKNPRRKVRVVKRIRRRR